MRVKLKMIGKYGDFTVGQIVNPTETLARQLIESRLAVRLDAPKVEPVTEKEPEPSPVSKPRIPRKTHKED